ncbi:MAG: hypothetical protein PHD76_09450 [Methylacidiphilales bacterium]|nr:hypothetical protein [Candidatus Methylacidiphilales bacterium]
MKKTHSTRRKSTRKKISKPKVKRAKKRTQHDEPISKPALVLIDRAASLLKKAILKSEEETEEGRKVLKKKALSFVDLASDRMTDAIHEGARLARKGMSKI